MMAIAHQELNASHVPPTPYSLMAEMLCTQDSLNTKFIGPNWRELAIQRDRINFGNAILEEGAELLNCDGSWKWWKSGFPAPDLSNTRIELVDMLHFLMSDALSTVLPGEQMFPTTEATAGMMAQGYMTVFNWDSADRDSLGALAETKGKQVYKPYFMRRALHALIGSSLLGTMTNKYEPIADAIDSTSKGPGFNSCGAANWTAFWAVAFWAGLSLMDVYTTYIGKSVLNGFRIANGDKQGRYHRHWFGGEEDNFYLMQFYGEQAEQGKAPSKAETVDYLTAKYAEFKASIIA